MLHCCKLFRRLFHALPSVPSSGPQPWLFIGLGNPGEKYQSTRHNALGISMNSVHFKSHFGEGEFEGTPVLLAKPQTYMNLSGESTGPLAAYYKLPLNRVLVIYDDMDLPCGVLRIQPRGGHGHHNGEFCRLRVGIGRPPGQMDPKAFMLQKFNKTARVRIDAALEEGVEILKMLLTKGLTECVNSANAEQKYKHLRVQNLPC